MGNAEGVTALDVRRVAGMTDATQLRYDQNESAIKMRDALDGVPTGGKSKLDQLKELKTLWESGLLSDTVYKDEQRRIMQR